MTKGSVWGDALHQRKKQSDENIAERDDNNQARKLGFSSFQDFGLTPKLAVQKLLSLCLPVSVVVASAGGSGLPLMPSNNTVCVTSSKMTY